MFIAIVQDVVVSTLHVSLLGQNQAWSVLLLAFATKSCPLLLRTRADPSSLPHASDLSDWVQDCIRCLTRKGAASLPPPGPLSALTEWSTSTATASKALSSQIMNRRRLLTTTLHPIGILTAVLHFKMDLRLPRKQSLPRAMPAQSIHLALRTLDISVTTSIQVRKTAMKLCVNLFRITCLSSILHLHLRTSARSGTEAALALLSSPATSIIRQLRSSNTQISPT